MDKIIIFHGRPVEQRTCDLCGRVIYLEENMHRVRRRCRSYVKAYPMYISLNKICLKIYWLPQTGEFSRTLRRPYLFLFCQSHTHPPEKQAAVSLSSPSLEIAARAPSVSLWSCHVLYGTINL